jgi:hypothetical protein
MIEILNIVVTIFLMFTLCFTTLIRNIDEKGHDEWDRFWEDTDGYRGFAGVKYHDNGSYDFWGNFFDTNPYSINNWD